MYSRLKATPNSKAKTKLVSVASIDGVQRERTYRKSKVEGHSGRMSIGMLERCLSIPSRARRCKFGPMGHRATAKSHSELRIGPVNRGTNWATVVINETNKRTYMKGVHELARARVGPEATGSTEYGQLIEVLKRSSHDSEMFAHAATNCTVACHSIRTLNGFRILSELQG